MKSGGNGWFWRWRRFIVDVLISASTVAVAFAAIGAAANPLYILLILGAIVLVGIGLMLEANVTAQPAGDIGPQPLRPPTEPKPARPGPQAMGRFDAVIVDATSV